MTYAADAGAPLPPKSRRCTSRCPVVGYLTCIRPRGHVGSCESEGYQWYRGKGYAKPHLVRRPDYIEAASGDAVRVAAVNVVPVFGRDRLPADKRWNSPLQVSYVTSEAAWARFIRRARQEHPDIARAAQAIAARS